MAPLEQITARFDALLARIMPIAPAWRPDRPLVFMYNIAASDAAAVAALGLVDVCYYQHQGFNFEHHPGEWRAAMRANGLRYVAFPLEDGSDLLELLDDDFCIGITADDEPGTPDGPNGTARRSPDGIRALHASWAAIARAAGRRMKPLFLNIVEAPTLYPNQINRDYYDVAEVAAWSADSYIPNLFGRGDSPVPAHLKFTSTYDGHGVFRAVDGPYFTAPLAPQGWLDYSRPILADTAAKGKPYGHYLSACGGGADPAQHYSIMQLRRAWWSGWIQGASFVNLFDTVVEGPEFITSGLLTRRDLLPTLLDLKRKMGVLHDTGFLFDRQRGGRTPYVRRPSAPARTCPNGVDQGPPDIWSDWDAPIGLQLPGGFEGVQLFNADRSDSALLILNLQFVDAVLSDPVSGVSSITVPAADVVCLHQNGRLLG